MMLKSVGAVMVTAAFLLCAGGGATAQKVDIDTQLRGLDVPERLQQFLGAMVTKMQGLEEKNAKLQKEQNRAQVVEAELRNKTLVEEELRGEVSWLKKDMDAFHNKTRAVEAEFRRENAALRIEVMELRNQSTKDIRRIHARLDQCEADSFSQAVERRQMQEQTPVCGREAVDNMLAVCCASGAPTGNGHRLQEFVGCDSLPPTCSLDCSFRFISIFDNCHDQALMRGLSAEELADWTSFYAVCSEVEQSAAEMGALQPVNIKMFRIIIIDQEAEHQAAMANDGSGAPSPPFGPVVLPPTGPPLAPSPDSSTDLEQYHAQCTTANILTCVPDCNATHHGFELLATIEGTDTKFSCNLANMLYSWVGAAALGGFLGQNVAAFVSAVISGAAGTYVLTLTEDAGVSTDLTVQPGQNVIISKDVGLEEAPRWGSGGFTVGEMGSLTLTYVNIGRVQSGLHDSVACCGTNPCSIIAVEGGSVALTSITVSATLLGSVGTQLSSTSSTLRLQDVAVPEFDPTGPLAGMMTGRTIVPPFFGTVAGTFTVSSGPCTVSDVMARIRAQSSQSRAVPWPSRQ
jgi:hypothetical protein